MPSSLRGKPDSHLRLVSDEEAVVLPDNARSTDESPTVISKTPPVVEPSDKDKVCDLSRKHATPESIVAGLRGRRLAHYELIEPIGVGGMAAVIRARDTQLDRFVALKILPPEMAQEPENVERFHQEAKAAAKLDHENIARVFNCGEDQGLFFIAFEFVEGMNLRTLLEQRGRVPVAEAIRYILQIAAGLEHAATRGVVHRDVKPSNIIITPNGRAKLVDMGLARNLERHGERDLTQSGVTLGTFDYISPEQALDPREADARSDIYSLGCTLYHILTGLPPVPDGTPAKKLHHHQHLSPVDPREIDPIIPDEIVMILNKMMAKNPKDRYQRPIHLVHHLMQVARQVGAADDMPEGVLFLDTPLPSQPASRPVLIIGLALASLVALILLLSLAPDPISIDQPTPLIPGIEKKGGQPNPYVGDSKSKINGALETIRPEVVNTLDDLKAVLSDPSSAEVKIRADIDLGTTGLVFKGGADQKLVLSTEDPDPETFRTIRFKHQNNGAAVGLSLEGGKEIVFRRIRFEIDSDSTPPRAAATVAIRGAKSVKFEQCIFTQPNAQRISKSPNRVPFASLLIDAPANAQDSRPLVELNDPYFDANSQNGGQVAIAINGPATIHMRNGAFRPHGAFFSFRENCTLEQTTVHLEHCIGFVEKGPAFRLHRDASAQLSVHHSVFSRPVGELSRDSLPEPGLMYLAGEKHLQYDGKQNLYHNLNTLVEKNLGDKNRQLIGADAFPKYLRENKGEDRGSVYLDLAASPLQNVNPLGNPDNLAFQLKPEYHAKFGLNSTWFGDMPGPRVVQMKNPSKSRIKIIVDADIDRTPGAFRNVAAALSSAVDGDIIYIKHGESREVVVAPVTLPPGITVTLKPFEGHQPILVLDPAFKKKDSTLFDVQKSKLHIMQMGILIEPDPGHETLSIVQVGEAAHLVFEKCVLTLKATNTAQLSVVTFLDLDRTMKMEGFPLQAKVEFHECLIRGKGDLVGLRGCRLLRVDVANSLVALDGSLLDIEATNKTMPMDQGVTWKMVASSVYTKDSVFALRTKTGKGLTKTVAEIKGCLLASLDVEQLIPIVLLDKDDMLTKYLQWEGDQNFYANFDSMRDNMRDWKDQFREGKSEYGKLTFPKLTDKMLRSLWDATPDWFAPPDGELRSGFGVSAETEKRLISPPFTPDE